MNSLREVLNKIVRGVVMLAIKSSSLRNVDVVDSGVESERRKNIGLERILSVGIVKLCGLVLMK